MYGLIATPPLGSVTQGAWTRGLLPGQARTHTTQPGPMDLVVARLFPSGAKVGKSFARQGGLLSIATQEPNWSGSPSPLGLVLVIQTPQRRLRYARGRALPWQNAKANEKEIAKS